MRLLRVNVVAADTCGGLLDGLDLWLRSPSGNYGAFEPLCLIGPNGAGKSQLLQVIAEIFQTIFHEVVPGEERNEGNARLQFEIEYLILMPRAIKESHVRISRLTSTNRKPKTIIQKKEGTDWIDLVLTDQALLNLLPPKVVGYTSGDNETLSLPFLLSRSSYADDVGAQALNDAGGESSIPDTRMMLIDYGTHLEVLVANLLLGTKEQRQALLHEMRIKDVHSFRCIVQLAHSSAPKAPVRRSAKSFRKGIQLTIELESQLDRLKRCATCFEYDEKTETYTLDFLVDSQTRKAFGAYWPNTLELHSTFHKLSMLNDLAIPRSTRERFRKEAATRRFASRLPEPQDEEKVFRFASVNFHPQHGSQIVNYVSLSDGEHQLAQILGTFCMMSFPNALFLLDEPESHFNPQWRVKFTSRLLGLPTSNGKRGRPSAVTMQECLLTTHSPFVPSDMQRERVFIFSKSEETGRISVRHPDIETYGTTFDTILDECFGVSPPISDVPRQDIDTLMRSMDTGKIQEGIDRLGHSVEKAFLADRFRQLSKTGES